MPDANIKSVVERQILARQWEEANLLWDLMADLGLVDALGSRQWEDAFSDPDRVFEFAEAVEIIRGELT